MNPPTRFFPASALAVVSCLLVSCGDSSGTGPPEEEQGPATMMVTPSQVTVDALGETVQFTATVWDVHGQLIPDAPLTWYTSDDKVALISEGGLATAIGDGTATILGSASASVFGWGDMIVTSTPIAIVTTSFRPGVVGLEYSAVLEGEGATQPLWSIIAGTLPDGLTLDENTGEIGGTPSTAGPAEFTVQLSSAGQIATQGLSLLVASGDYGIGFGDDQFALIPAGSFQMGSENGRDIERPVHTVNITQPFMMLKTEVTQHQWSSIMEENPSAFPDCGDVCPVEMVSWDDIQVFLGRLNTADPGKNYRLPTEAEWEYAARAGTTGDYGGTGLLDEMGWYLSNAGSYTQFVAQKLPNDWGLFDMHGNVDERVQDWYSESYYAVSPSDDPPGPTTGTYRVIRGGAVDRSAEWARSATRSGGSLTPPYDKRSTRGFRLVRDP